MTAFKDGSLYRLFPKDDWEALEGDTIAYAPHDEADGFFHLSGPTQVLETARLHYASHERLVAMGCPHAAPGAALKWEASRGGELFPHVYGEVRREWFDHAVALVRQPDGQFLPPGDNGIA